ncbi:response regulator [candidate division GN15 bacterium]|nr:response regulator [candidate division GN15 bacterium]
MASDMTILVVDDEQIVLDSVTKHLGKEEYNIKTVLSAQDGLDAIEAEKIDIVLTDLMMPEIDGLEFMRKVRESHPCIPVIMITGYATINTALQATQLGAFDYIAKPFSRKELLAVVGRAADLVRGSECEDEKAGKDTATKGGLTGKLKSVGDHCWMMVQKDELVMLGVEHAFVSTLGKVQNVYLPTVGDEIRQGSVFMQIFTSDMRSHPVQSPLSGTVVEVNERVLDDPVIALQDAYGEGWLVKLKPSRFEHEREVLGI